MKTQKPSFLSQKLQLSDNRGTRSGATLTQDNSSLGLAREGFIYRGTKLFNLLPDYMKQESSMNKFKKMIKVWTKENIPIKS